MRKPKRLFKNRPIPEAPKFPADMVEKLKHARSKIDPFRTFRMQMPDSSVFETTGADLIAHAEATVSLAEAINRGESRAVIKAAFDKLDSLLEN